MCDLMSVDFSESKPILLDANIKGVDSFHNQKSEMVEHLQNLALKDQKNRIGITYVWPHDGQIAGYVSVSMYLLRRSLLTRSLKKQIRFKEIPVMLLGQLATHTDYQKNGLGKRMVIWTVSLALKYSREIGCRGVVLHSDPSLIEWYKERCGFHYLLDDEEVGNRRNIMYFDLGD